MTDQRALITGSSRGIGRSIARALAQRGFAIALHGRSLSGSLEEARAEIAALGVQVTAIAGDLGEEGAAARLLDQAETDLGPLTTLVSNAGVAPLRRGDLLDAQADSLDHCLALNARAPFFMLQDFARRLVARDRSQDLVHAIVSVSSISAVAVSPNRADYCMSKAATAMMARAFALRLAPEGIQVFDVQPGVIATDMSRAALPEYERRIRDEGIIPLGRVGTSEEIGRLCAAAAAGDIPYAVGQVLRPDGGISVERL